MNVLCDQNASLITDLMIETSPSCNQARDELVDYDDDNGSVLEDDHAVLLSNNTKTKPINFCSAFLLPGVISVSEIDCLCSSAFALLRHNCFVVRSGVCRS